MFQTDHYYLQSKKIKSAVKIVMLADLHNKSYGEENRILLKKIREISPDFVCIAGDMLIGHSKIPYEAGQQLVLELAKEYPVFYGLGNHEARMKHDTGVYGDCYENYMAPIRRAGVQVLVNECAEIKVGESCFRIYGYNLPLKYFEKFNRYVFEDRQLAEVLGNCKTEEDYTILLAHNPVYFKQYAAWGADLSLSGHLHGGIIRLPFIGGVITPQAKLFPRYSGGEYKIGEKRLIVSRGLGTHTIPIRFNNKPELSVIHLGPASF